MKVFVVIEKSFSEIFKGSSFTECKFTLNGQIDVENIVVDPDFASEQFILYGSKTRRYCWSIGSFRLHWTT